MSVYEEEPLSLVLAQSGSLTLVGVKSLVARGCSDMKIREEAEQWLKRGLKLQEEANTGTISPPPTSWTPDWRRIVEYGRQIHAGNHPELVAKSLGMTPEDEDKARTMHYFVPSVVASVAQRMQQEEEQRQTDLKKYDDTMREAFQCFEKGIRLSPDHPELQFQIGMACNFGNGVPQDHAIAFEWFRNAAEQGHAEAQYSLCGFHDEEFCVPQQNMVQAAAWCRKAAEQGQNMAQFHMCNLYLLGIGVQRDKVEACFWHELFISNKDESAAMRSRNDFPAKLSPHELAGVQQRVAVWLSAHQSAQQKLSDPRANSAIRRNVDNRE